MYDTKAEDHTRLTAAGLQPLIPIRLDPSGAKKPYCQWGHFITDRTDPSAQEIAHWIAASDVIGWAWACGRREGFVLDVEPPGVADDDIAAVLADVPDHAKRRSVSGGMHVYVLVDGGMPTGHCARSAGEPGVLLAEVRGYGKTDDSAGAYAVVTGPGRPPLAEDFAPWVLSRDEADALVDRVRACDKSPKVVTPPASQVRGGSAAHTRGGVKNAGGGTGSLLFDAVESGQVSWESLLDDGWTYAGHNSSGKTWWRRPDYGLGTSADTSANTLRGFFVCHSTSVTWVVQADRLSQAMTAAEVFAWTKFGGDYRKAMLAIEDAAEEADPAKRPSWAATWPQEFLDKVRSLKPLTQGSLRTVPVGQALAKEHLAGRFLYAPTRGWLRWDGMRWGDCPEEIVLREAEEWAHQWIAGMVIRGAPDGVINDAMKYRERNKVVTIVAVARGQACVLVTEDELDQHEYLLNTLSGVVDLRNGNVTPHDPSLLMTKVTRVGYTPGYRHPDWDTAIGVLDVERRRYLQQALGLALYGKQVDDTIIFAQGEGSNGKTTLLGGLLSALGDYGVLVSERAIAGAGNAHPTELMDLHGARLALMEETPDGAYLDLTRLKKITGSAKIAARRMRMDSVTFTPTHSLVITTNALPRVKDTDHGTWRRLVLVKFTKQFGGRGATDAREAGLRGRLISDTKTDGQRAALAWAVEGAIAAHVAGMTVLLPTVIEDDTEEWRSTADMVGTFLAENVVLDPNGVVWTRDLWSAWQTHAMECGIRYGTEADFKTKVAAARRLASPTKVRTKTLTISRPARNGSSDLLPAQAVVWKGLRWIDGVTGSTLPETSLLSAMSG